MRYPAHSLWIPLQQKVHFKQFKTSKGTSSEQTTTDTKQTHTWGAFCRVKATTLHCVRCMLHVNLFSFLEITGWSYTQATRSIILNKLSPRLVNPLLALICAGIASTNLWGWRTRIKGLWCFGRAPGQEHGNAIHSLCIEVLFVIFSQFQVTPIRLVGLGWHTERVGKHCNVPPAPSEEHWRSTPSQSCSVLPWNICFWINLALFPPFFFAFWLFF